MKVYIKRGRQEKRSARRCWWVYAWRIVDEHNNDMVQPGFATKPEAVDYARKHQEWEYDE